MQDRLSIDSAIQRDKNQPNFELHAESQLVPPRLLGGRSLESKPVTPIISSGQASYFNLLIASSRLSLTLRISSSITIEKISRILSLQP